MNAPFVSRRLQGPDVCLGLGVADRPVVDCIRERSIERPTGGAGGGERPVQDRRHPTLHHLESGAGRQYRKRATHEGLAESAVAVALEPFEHVVLIRRDDVGAVIGFRQRDPSARPDHPAQLPHHHLGVRAVNQDSPGPSSIERFVRKGQPTGITVCETRQRRSDSGRGHHRLGHIHTDGDAYL